MWGRIRRDARMVGAVLVLVALSVGTGCTASRGSGPDVVRDDFGYAWPARGDLAGDQDFIAEAVARVDAPQPHLLWAGPDGAPDAAGRSVALFVIDAPEVDSPESNGHLQFETVVRAVTRDSDGRWSTRFVESFAESQAAVRLPVGLPNGWGNGVTGRQFLLLRQDVDRVSPVTDALDGGCAIQGGLAACPDGLLAFGGGDDKQYRHPALSSPLFRWSGTAQQLRSLVQSVRDAGNQQPATVAVTDAQGRLLLGKDQHLFSFTLSQGNHRLGEFRLPDGRVGVIVFVRIVAVTDNGLIAPGAWTMAWVPNDGSPAVFGENTTDTNREVGQGIAVAIPHALGRPLIMATSDRDLTLRTQPSLPVVANEIITEQGRQPADGYRLTVFHGAAPVTVEYLDNTGKVTLTRKVEIPAR